MRVLIVEDDSIVAMLIEDSLIEGGHEVLGSVASSSAARRQVERDIPDLMLVDIHLIDGETGCVLAREVYDHWQVRTLFVTGSLEKARQCADAIGALIKPFAATSISAAVDAASAILAGKRPTYVPPELELF